MGDTTRANTYQSWFNLGQTSFNSKLWNGSYYNIDTGGGWNINWFQGTATGGATAIPTPTPTSTPTSPPATKAINCL